jgi:diguanylate cyclase (GGDEF)-like protein
MHLFSKTFETFLLLIAAAFAGLAPAAHAADAVTLQLKWSHEFQFAGYYAAKERGYYREAGLDVTIRSAEPGMDVVAEVVSGKAQYGTGSSSLLLDRHAGKPVVVLAAIFQHSPYVLITGSKDGTLGIHDLAGKRIMIEPLGDELIAYLRREGITTNDFKRLDHSFNIEDLINGKTDVIASYSTSKPFYLNQAGFRHQIFSPRSAGIDFYGDNLFTSEQELKNHPQRVEAFRAASLRGWKYAMEHPEEIIDLMLQKYTQQHSRNYLRFEAEQMVRLVEPDQIEIGYMYPGRWEHIAGVYAELDMLPRDFSLDGFIYTPRAEGRKLTPVYLYLAVSAGIILLICVIAVREHRLNRRLAGTVTELNETNSQLLHMAHYDALTKLPNRLLFSANVEQSLRIADRNKSRVALMVIDLDNFKTINDSHGHLIGDVVLKETARRIRRSVRRSDTVARIGGDEFVALLQDIESEQAAILIGEKIRAEVEQPILVEQLSLSCSMSIGIAIYPDHGLSENELTENADHAMYQMKSQGGNRVQLYRKTG